MLSVDYNKVTSYTLRVTSFGLWVAGYLRSSGLLNYQFIGYRVKRMGVIAGKNYKVAVLSVVS